MQKNKLLESIRKMEEKLAFLKKAESVNKVGLFCDGKTFSNQERVNFENDLWLIEISSSLMIPESYLPLLKKKSKKFKSLANYLHFLVVNYKIHIANGIIPSYKNVTTKYQDKDLDLKKVGIRAKGCDWAELQLLRCSHGMSMSAIFVYLLRIDSVEFAEALSVMLVDAGIPNRPRLDFFGELRLEHQDSVFSRVFRYQEGNYG